MIIYPDNIHHIERFGGKAAALAKLRSLPVNIPDWFAIDGDIQPDDLVEAAGSLGCERYAVRSSARGEDGVEHSFAGQYDTFLYVELPDIARRVEQVRSSGVSQHIETYQQVKGLEGAFKPTVIVQAMVEPDVSGVAFSANPVSGERGEAIVAALWGTGSALVSGEADADQWTVKEKIVETRIAAKTRCHVSCSVGEEGVKMVDVSEDRRNIPCLTDDQVLEVVSLTRVCEDYFGCPQDIEWALAGGKIYLLQSRPITTLNDCCEDGRIVWDNSNIAESYSGVTSTLTFTFANRVYEHVYREFCKLLSVPGSKIKKHDGVFSGMLGHIRGRVYYNLNHWYTVLSLLPGFSLNRGFMEKMMGVKEPMPEDLVEGIVAETRTNKFLDTLALLRMSVSLVGSYRSLDGQIKLFYERLNGALGSGRMALDDMSRDEIRECYVELEAKLLKRWDAPLVNDFFAMVFYGVLGSLCAKWLGDESIQNQLLMDDGAIISAEPPKRISAMADIVRGEAGLAEVLADFDIAVGEKEEAVRSIPVLDALYNDYLEVFGDRCMEELKLESPTVRDNPQALLCSIGAMAKRNKVSSKLVGKEEVPVVKIDGWQGLLFRWILKQTQDRVRDRENLRFERTRLFGRVRQLVLASGRQLAFEGFLDDGRDVFFLTIEELMFESVPNEDLRELVEKRRLENHAGLAVPPDRFETFGEVTADTPLQATSMSSASLDGQMKGVGACPGVVRGRVRVVLEPQKAVLQEGEILVAQQTDPGWVVLFPAASGLLVERGSLLSHSAIVARELQLPCIVSLKDITTILQTGDFVEMDGRTGVVTKITDEN